MCSYFVHPGASAMSINHRQFCCDLFKSHRHRVYSYLRVCSNCLWEIRKRNPQVASVDTPSPSSLSLADADPAAFPRQIQALTPWGLELAWERLLGPASVWERLLGLVYLQKQLEDYNWQLEHSISAMNREMGVLQPLPLVKLEDRSIHGADDS